MWFIGADTAPAATATGIVDSDRYALDLRNSGTDGLTLHAQSGNGTHELFLTNNGIGLLGTFVHTAGVATFGSAVTMASTLLVSGAVTMASSLNVASNIIGSAAIHASGSMQAGNTFTVVTGASNFGGQVISNVPNGTPPYTATSTTVCTNVNADLFDNLQLSALISTGSYTGDGSGARLINLGFQPTVVVITTPAIAAGGTSSQMGVLLDTATSTTIFGARLGVTTAVIAAAEITRITSAGFIVDAAAVVNFGNTSGATYRYAAWRTS